MKLQGMPGKASLLAAVLSAFLLFGGAAPAQAHDRDNDCYRRIHRAEEKLEREIHRHGPNSRQAQRRRHDLEEARERCHGYRDR
jgi:ribosome-associated translation inhibitor RaiA